MVHEISAGAMAAFEAQHAARFGSRFAGWWAAHARVLGPAVPAQVQAAPQMFAEELAFVDLQEEEQQFLYMAARLRMPGMDDVQFIEVMNAIVSQDDTDAKLARIEQLARSGSVAHG